MINVEDEEDPQLFVALYDFQSGGENQLSLKKGEQVRFTVYNVIFILIRFPTQGEISFVYAAMKLRIVD